MPWDVVVVSSSAAGFLVFFLAGFSIDDLFCGGDEGGCLTKVGFTEGSGGSAGGGVTGAVGVVTIPGFATAALRVR